MNDKALKTYLTGFCIWVAIAIVALLVTRYTLFVRTVTGFTFDDATSEYKVDSLAPFATLEISQENPYVECDDEWLEILVDSSATVPTIKYPKGFERFLRWNVSDGRMCLVVDVTEIESPVLYLDMTSPVELRVPAASLRQIVTTDVVATLATLKVQGDSEAALEIATTNDVALERLNTPALKITTNWKNLDWFSDPYNRYSTMACESRVQSIEIRGSMVGEMDVVAPDTAYNYDVTITPITEGRGRRKHEVGEMRKLHFAASGEPDATSLYVSFTGELPAQFTIQPGIRNRLSLTSTGAFTAKCDNILKSEGYDDNE